MLCHLSSESVSPDSQLDFLITIQYAAFGKEILGKRWTLAQGIDIDLDGVLPAGRSWYFCRVADIASVYSAFGCRL
jgi:hypothetical protein